MGQMKGKRMKVIGTLLCMMSFTMNAIAAEKPRIFVLTDIENESEEFRDSEFHGDVSALIQSFGVTDDLSILLTSAYLESNNATPLLDAVSAIWRRPDANDPRAVLPALANRE